METELERLARVERETAVIAEAEADIAAGNAVRWSEFKAELLARDREIMARQERGLVTGP